MRIKELPQVRDKASKSPQARGVFFTRLKIQFTGVHITMQCSKFLFTSEKKSKTNAVVYLTLAQKK
jgi:hypothetical protein